MMKVVTTSYTNSNRFDFIQFTTMSVFLVVFTLVGTLLSPSGNYFADAFVSSHQRHHHHHQINPIGRTSSTTATSTLKQDTSLSVASYGTRHHRDTAANSDADDEHVFISVKEAEEAVRQERESSHYERQALRDMLEEQRLQLEALQASRRRRSNGGAAGHGPAAASGNVIEVMVGTGGMSSTSQAANTMMGRRSSSGKMMSTSLLVEPDPVFDRINNDGRASSSYTPPKTVMWRDSVRYNKHQEQQHADAQQQQHHREQLFEIESQLRDVMEQNSFLLKQLHEQHIAHEEERAEWESRIAEEHDRLLHLQEELCVERAYFDTSRKLLEGLLETEQKKVRALQDELYAREELYMYNQHEERQKQFQYDMLHHQQHHPEYNHQQQQNHQHVEVIDVGMMTNPLGGGGGNGHGHRHHQQHQTSNGRSRGQPHQQVFRVDGLQRNDIQSPLYP